MRYSVSHWAGRLGNNIQQTANAIMLAETKGHTFEQNLDHEVIDKFILSFGSDGHHVAGKFYNWEPTMHCDNGVLEGGNEIGIPKEYVYKNMRRICKEYIYPNLKVQNLDPFDEDTVVVHIRGGDIIEREYERPHNYVQNPLDYYMLLLDIFPNMIVVTEPINNNPVLPELKKIDRIKFQTLTVAEDYATLLAAKNLATSGVGTFGVSAALCSHNIKNLYTSDAYLTEHLNYTMLYDTDVIINEVELKDYIPVYPCSWKNDAEQRKLMLEYKLPE
jgi:hypothetical protein